jgi:quercetin dioxygenase-like cupin family protein
MNVRSALLAVALAVVGFAQAQSPGIQRTILQRSDLEGGQREVILGLAEIAPGVAAGRHSHPGIETGYVLSGSATIEIDGEAPRVLKAGDSYFVPAGKVHDARTVGDTPVRVLATYVVEKGKPLATPAPR